MPLAQIWTLTPAGGAEQPLATWGIARAVLTRASQDADVFEISIPSAAFDDDDLFAFESLVTLKRYPSVDSAGLPTGTPVKWFVGVCVKTPRTGRPNAEGMDYVFHGVAWYALANIVYQQNWTMFAGGTAVTAPQSRVNLFANLAGALIKTDAQITDALTWALGSTALFQAGSLPAGIYVPTEQGTDLTCAEVIKRALRWHPDAVTWVDYTTTPPTLNIGLRSALTPLNLAVAGLPASELDIVARNDLVHPVVSIKFSQVNTVNGQQTLAQLTQKYPTMASEDQLRALILSVDLAGVKSSFLQQAVTVAALPNTGLTNAQMAAWFTAHCPELADGSVDPTSLTYDTGTPLTIVAINDDGTAAGTTDPISHVFTPAAVYGAELLDGAIADWMQVHSQLVLVTANFSYKQSSKDAAGNPVDHNLTKRAFQVKVLSTDANTGTYKSLGTTVPGDSVPTNLAQNFYSALAQLQYEGAFALEEAEVGTGGGPFSGRSLNLTGGRTEWATMAAMIHTVVEDLATGRTTLRFGPHTYLSPADFIAHLRATRQRVIPELAERSGGVTTGGAQNLPQKHLKNAAAKVEAAASLDIWYGTPAGGNPGANKVTFTPTDISGLSLPAANKTLKPRIIQVCDGGTMKSQLIMASETW